MSIDEHIKNLEKYCEDDDLFEKDGDFKEFCDNHIADIKAVIEDLKTTQADLYEANNCISDLLDVAKERDRIIDLMARAIDNYDSQLEICQYRDKEDVIKAFEEFENMINIRKKKREEFNNGN